MAHINLPEGLPGIRGPMAFSPETSKPLNELAEVLLRSENSLTRGEREALDVASAIDATGLSAERQSRMHIDLARAHAQRRHSGEALQALLTAEQHAPEQLRTHALARQLIRDLVALAGRRPS